MPTRKQRRRAAKEKRHEYEFVYVDAEGNEVDAPPEEAETDAKERRNGSKPEPQKNQQKNQKSSTQQRGGRAGRAPQPPSWERAGKRAVLLGAVVFVLFAFTTRKSGNSYLSALVPALIYTALFIPFTYAIDRFAYRRWQAKQQQQGGGTKQPGTRPAKRPTKKR